MTGSIRPQAVLFACTYNAVRSPMAEALTRYYFGREIYVDSAGVKKSALDPFAVAAIAELGLDISAYRPKTFDDLEETSFDAIVTLSPEAHHKALEFTRSMAVDVFYWPTLDATAAQGSRDQILDAYRATRDQLQKRIMAFLKT